MDVTGWRFWPGVGNRGGPWKRTAEPPNRKELHPLATALGCHKFSVDVAMPPITRGLFCARKIWIDDALGGAARCRRVALRQRRVAAFVIVGPPVRQLEGTPQ